MARFHSYTAETKKDDCTTYCIFPDNHAGKAISVKTLDNAHKLSESFFRSYPNTKIITVYGVRNNQYVYITEIKPHKSRT